MNVASFKAFVDKDPNYATALALLPYGAGEPRVGAWSDIRGVVADAYTAVINGEDPQTALDAAAVEADALLAEQ